MHWVSKCNIKYIIYTVHWDIMHCYAFHREKEHWDIKNYKIWTTRRSYIYVTYTALTICTILRYVLGYSALSYGALINSALSYGALSYGVLKYGALSYGALINSALSYGVLKYGALSYVALINSALSYGVLNYGALICIYRALQHWCFWRIVFVRLTSLTRKEEMS